MTASHRLYRRFATVNCWLGAAATGLIMMFYGYEVVARYLFNAPTLWTVTTSGYLMLASVFLALPLITLERLHVESTFLIESAPRRSRPGLRLLALLISAGYCLLAAWMTAIVAIDSARSGVLTNDALTAPKWILDAFVAYGYATAAIAFIFLALSRSWRTPPESPHLAAHPEA